jgi:tRNA A58 N-methylase Trm61
MNITAPSSYAENDIGTYLYNYVYKLKPKKVIDFGVLHGYSTAHMALALKSIGAGKVKGYDLFEKYPYNRARRVDTQEYLDIIGLSQYAQLYYKDFNEWLREDEEFDLLHVDISNDGTILEKVYNKFKGRDCRIIFEGGTQERDNVGWMLEYKRAPITTAKIKYRMITNDFPGLGEMILV